jgi:hypothetical protein
MSMKFAFVFPGQGSQSVGMMAGYGDAAPVRETFAEASDALGQDLWAMVSDGPADLLNQTVNTQPVMLAAGVAAYRVWQSRGGPAPALMAGHSLGEYTALVCADAIGFADAVKLVRLRAEAMQSAVPEGVGAMAAVLGLDDAAVRAVCAEAAQGEMLEAVNFNSPGPGGHRRPQGGGGPGLRPGQGEGRQAGPAPAGVRAVPLRPDEARGGKTARRAGGHRGEGARRCPSCTTRTWPAMPIRPPSATPWPGSFTARCAGSKPFRPWPPGASN